LSRTVDRSVSPKGITRAIVNAAVLSLLARSVNR
jgi:hypothetical protein